MVSTQALQRLNKEMADLQVKIQQLAKTAKEAYVEMERLSVQLGEMEDTYEKWSNKDG